MKPGWVRVGFPPVMSLADIDYVLDALAFLAERGRDLMGLYRADPATGHWTLASAAQPPATTLDALCLWREHAPVATPAKTLPGAAEIFSRAHALANAAQEGDPAGCCALPDQAHALRWFHL